MKQFVTAKLHCVRVTASSLNYHGSITLDPLWLAATGLEFGEFVEIYNKASGARISTYIIEGTHGARECILNGAAARTCQVGDELIIVGRQWCGFRPERAPVLIFNEKNEVVETILYYKD